MQMRIGYWLFRTSTLDGVHIVRKIIGYAENGQDAIRIAQEWSARTGALVWIDSGTGVPFVLGGSPAAALPSVALPETPASPVDPAGN